MLHNPHRYHLFRGHLLPSEEARMVQSWNPDAQATSLIVSHLLVVRTYPPVDRIGLTDSFNDKPFREREDW